MAGHPGGTIQPYRWFHTSLTAEVRRARTCAEHLTRLLPSVLVLIRLAHLLMVRLFGWLALLTRSDVSKGGGDPGTAS